MPLFFIIAIAAGGIVVGATTVDVTQDMRARHTQATATFDPSPYATAADCQAAASRAGAPASACNGKI